MKEKYNWLPTQAVCYLLKDIFSSLFVLSFDTNTIENQTSPEARENQRNVTNS